MAIEHFEYAILGGGKAGKSLATQMATAGKATVMVEKGMIGGTCINVACIPTKTIVRSAKVAELARKASEYGINVQFDSASPVGVRHRRDTVVGEMVRRNQAIFDRSGMTLLLGTATFTGPKTVEVALNDGSTRQFTAEHVVINTGTRPAHPPLPGLADAAPLDSESIQRLDHLPSHLIVLGGGYIALEFAQIFRRFGSAVTIVQRGQEFLPKEDRDIAEQILQVLRDDGIEILLGATTGLITGRSGQQVQVPVTTPAGQQILTGSDLFVALGRAPVTEELNLAAAGVTFDAKGFVPVNERLETSVPGVYAVGDVNGGPQFTHASYDDFRILSANFAGGNRTTTGRTIPYTLFIDPELGRVGLTESEARAAGYPIRVGRLPVAAIPRAMTLGETRGLMKVVVHAESDLILGCSILAPEGGEVMAVVQIAMQAGLPASAFRNTIFAHPTMAEALGDLFTRLV